MVWLSRSNYTPSESRPRFSLHLDIRELPWRKGESRSLCHGFTQAVLVENQDWEAGDSPCPHPVPTAASWKRVIVTSQSMDSLPAQRPLGRLSPLGIRERGCR